jgi:hypothetical protein
VKICMFLMHSRCVEDSVRYGLFIGWRCDRLALQLAWVPPRGSLNGEVRPTAGSSHNHLSRVFGRAAAEPGYYAA